MRTCHSFKMKQYHVIWTWLFLAWMMCYIDRSLTGPVVSWMIKNQVGFFADAPMQHALGGVIGSMFFAGYMLTQFPAGYLGDRYGRRAMVVISTAWAGVTTFISALATSLFSFVSLRVLTGLGEGAYYSNDRAIIDDVTPRDKKGFAMGVVFVGLALGLTLATIVTPPLMDEAALLWGNDLAWTVPFLIFSPLTILVSWGLWTRLRPKDERDIPLRRPLFRLIAYSAIFLTSIMAVFQTTLSLGWSSLWQTLAIIALAWGLIFIIYRRLGMKSAPVLRNRNLLLMYFSAIPILYTLWFFGYWALLVVADSAQLGLSGAALYAGLFGLASMIGYPLGGLLCDRGFARGRGRKFDYLVMCAAVAGLIIILAWDIKARLLGLAGLAVLLFLIGVLFSAMQTVHMTMTSDLAPKKMMAQAFGMWNLVAEIGALLSPVVSGTLRDLTGDWSMAALLTAALLFASCAMIWFVREPGSSNVIVS